jgi:hypothetical protein
VVFSLFIRRKDFSFADFSKTGISLYNINFAERNSEAAMGGGGGVVDIF